jgi:hypothetical protein
MAMISSSLRKCMKLFVELIESERLAQSETDVSVRKWEDELGRLRVWAANIGAHQSGQSSLDYRLRDASHLKMETMNLLNSLLETLRDLHEVVDGSSDAENEDEFDELYEGDLTVVQQIYQAIVDVINYLYRMSMAIRQPARHDQLLETRMIDATVFIPWAERHVSDKYPGLEPEIVQRLGAAMARQRAVLKYRERHRAKLGQGVEGNEERHSRAELMSETAATEFIEAPENHLQVLDGMSDSGVSRTSYATTLVASQNGVCIPPPPLESANQAPFECPYCFVIISVKDRKDWARHIFRDVMPYTCIYLGCTTPSKVYESRRQWYNHLRIQHALETSPDSCVVCPLCKLAIQRPVMFERHVGRHLEELTLFVLPRIEPEDEAGTHSAQVSNGTASEGHSTAKELSLDSQSLLGSESDLDIADPAVDGSSREDVREEDAISAGTPIETSEKSKRTRYPGDDALLAELKQLRSKTADPMKEAVLARLEKVILEDGIYPREAQEAVRETARLLAAKTAQEIASRAAKYGREGETRIVAEASAAIKGLRETDEAVAKEEEISTKEEAPTEPAVGTDDSPTRKEPIKFKDALGRKFTFPFHLCCTWEVRTLQSIIFNVAFFI